MKSQGVFNQMSKKVTISVPDDLYEQLGKWRESFNFSKIFQNAISGVIQKKEDFQKKIKEELDISSIIERLQKEKLELEKNFRDIGKIDGLEWIKTAHFREIKYALNWKPGHNPLSDETLGDYFSQIFKSDHFQSGLNIPNLQDNFNEFTTKYIDGWKEGVHEFWNEIRDKIYTTK